MILKLIQSERERIPQPYIKEADDGMTAVDELTAEMNRGGYFDFILMDYVMVCVFYIPPFYPVILKAVIYKYENTT